MNQPLTNAPSAPRPRNPMPFAHRLRRIGLTLAIAALSFGSYAADTEIYTTPGPDTVNPNLLLVIDTSSSMLNEEYVYTYDPAGDYPVPSGQVTCPPNLLYLKVDPDDPPACNSSSKISITRNSCEDSKSDLQTKGRYTGKLIGLLEYSGESGWQPINAFNFRNIVYDAIECEADNGKHGGSQSPDTHTQPKQGFDFDAHWWVPSGGLDWTQEPYSTSSQSTVYTSHYLHWYHYHKTPTLRPRIDIALDAVKSLIDKAADVNIGLMRFDAYGDNAAAADVRYNEGGAIVHPIVDINVPENRAALKSKLDSGSVFAPGLALICPDPRPNPPFNDCPPGKEGQKIKLNDRVVVQLHAVSTPLTETAYEALLYFRGERARFGNPAPRPQTDVNRCILHTGHQYLLDIGAITQADLDAYGGHCTHTRSVPESFGPDGQTYISPITSSCGNNFMAIFTDGVSAQDDDADALIAPLIAAEPTPFNTCEYKTDCDLITGICTPVETCLADLARYMYTQDLSPLPGKQKIISYYIAGFGTDQTLLDQAAQQGGTGRAFSVTDPEELITTFEAILSEVQTGAVGFVAPAFGVDDFDSLRHNNDLYFSMFEPSPWQHWDGNLKKYRLKADENADSGAIIADANGVNAIDKFGLFEKNAESFWALPGADPDGIEVPAGGAAHRLFDYSDPNYDADSRAGHVYTYLTDYPPDAFNGSGIRLTAITEGNTDIHNHLIDENNFGITRLDMRLSASAEEKDFRNSIIQWLRGVDVRDHDLDGDITEGRPVMGGVLHSEPVLVDYGPNDKAIVITTNDGYLHVFATKTADPNDLTSRLEHFSIVPKPMLKRINQVFYKHKRGPVIYQLDGTVEIWRHDAGRDGTIDVNQGDHIYAYFGQRRGGDILFAFDITDRSAPKLLWEINPANIPSNKAMPFSRLGQTWSKPRHGTILVPGTNGLGLVRKDVILVGGGYDEEDDIIGSARTADSKGNAVYILDAQTGEVIWWASKGEVRSADLGAGVSPDLINSDMQYGFPSEIRPFDIQGDGIWDSFFAADAGGQIWRFDINNRVPPGNNQNPFRLASRITGGVIADLQVDDPSDITVANNRRLYNAPDISLARKSPDDPIQLVLSIGTGYRAHPLYKGIEDRLYVLKYDDVSSRPAVYSGVKIRPSDLLDVTNQDYSTPIDALRGWYINIDATEGEKALSESLTIDGSVIFTTYTPPPPVATVCGNNFGIGRAYIVSIFDGSPVVELDDPIPDGDLTLADRRITLRSSGIPPVPKVIYPDLGDRDGKLIFGRDLLPIDISDQRATLGYWIQEDAQE